MPTSVALGNHFESFVRDQVRSGRFNNTSEVVRAGLRLLEEHEARVDALRAEIAAGRASGAAKSGEAVFDRLEARYAAQVDDGCA